MTQLFKQKDIVEKEELGFSIADVLESKSNNSAELPLNKSLEETRVLPQEQQEEPIDLASALGNLTGGSETTATDVIRELGTADENLPMKTILPNPAAFTAVKILEDYNTYLGMDNVTEFLHNFVDWHYKHLCAHKGKRAEQQFQALTQVKQEEFQLEKEAKGLLHR